MIPLSNGRSPRIDQFYATLRTYKSHQFNEDFNNRSEQDKSIQQIRSLGKQILEPEPITKRFHLNKQIVNSLHRSSQSLVKPSNLYDKYKFQNTKKIDNVVNNVKVKITKEQINKVSEKTNVSKKYLGIPSKIEVKGTLKGLNYAKKAQMQAQKLKKQKFQAQKVEKQIKTKQNFFQKTSSNTARSFKQLGLLKHAEQLRARKQKHIQKIRTQQLEKQMSFVTFHPQIISKKFSIIQQNFEKRNSLANTQRLSRQKNILKQEIQAFSFIPQTNTYKNADSKVLKIWKAEQNNNKKIDSTIQYTALQKTLNSNKSLRTANQTMQINLKSLNQLSFIFQ